MKFKPSQINGFASSAAVSGSNTGDQTISLTGDVTGSGTGSFAATLATVNSNTGAWGSASAVPVITVNGKGLITAVSTAALGTAATAATGTSGHTVPFLDGANTWSSTQTLSAALSSNYSVQTGDGNGINFWNSGIAYSIYMSASTSGGAGRVTGETTSDYNMYFRMSSGTNRGFVFSNAGTNVAGIDASGNIRAVGNLTAANFSGSSSGTNTGDQTISLTGDVTGSGTGSFATTLATVNSNTGAFGSAAAVPVITVNGKGLITAVTTAALGTAATAATGTSGHTVPFLDGTNTWSGTTHTFTASSANADVILVPGGAALYSVFEMKGNAGAVGLNITTTTGASYLSCDSFTFRNGATTTNFATLTSGVFTVTGNIMPEATNTRNIGSAGVKYATVYATTFSGTATSAQFADLAERYAADAIYAPGTVLVIGGSSEVTACYDYGSAKVAGIVSTDPALMMNSEAGSDETHPYVALRGRVPCQVIGPITKGDVLITSEVVGRACAAPDPLKVAACQIVGKALESHAGGPGVIEVMV